MKQRITEWIASKTVMDYHEKQFKEVYRSTVHFANWLESLRYLNKKGTSNILDIGAGQGANLLYLSKRYQRHQFVGVEINPNLVKKGNKIIRMNNCHNCKLVLGDLYNLSKDYIAKFDGIISLQTLSWLPDYKFPIKKITELKTKWIALSSLFYDGDISCSIKIRDYSDCVDKKPYVERYYNIYSLKLVQELFNKCGYKKFIYTPFEIDIDLPKPSTKGMGTFTERLQNGRRLQISGPLLQPWYFLLASKE